MESFNRKIYQILIDNEFKYIISNQLFKLFSDTDIIDTFCDDNIILLKKWEKYWLFRKIELNSLFWIDKKLIDSRFFLDKKPNNILFLNWKIIYEIAKNWIIKMESMD